MPTRKYREKCFICKTSIAYFPIGTIRSNSIYILTFCSFMNPKIKQQRSLHQFSFKTQTQDDSVLIRKYFSQHSIERLNKNVISCLNTKRFSVQHSALRLIVFDNKYMLLHMESRGYIQLKAESRCHINLT